MAPVASAAKVHPTLHLHFLNFTAIDRGRRGIHRRHQGGVRAPVGVPARWCGRLSPRNRPQSSLGTVASSGHCPGRLGEWSGGSGRASPLRSDLAARLADAVDDADRP
jgi:hypothetical protein